MKKFLICGLGSIGQRHARLIEKITKGTAEIAAYRLRKLDIVINDNLEATFGIKPEVQLNLMTFDRLDHALAWKPDAVFVTNPIYMHIATAIAAAENGAHIFIEKPLDCSAEELPKLQHIITKKKLTCMVGYQQRYHPAYKRIKDLLNNRILGRLISADLHFGEWLPGMHPYEDYRESHAARADQGGGVILCLSHEIDIAFWLFGTPINVFALGGHLSDLDLDVEDNADILLNCWDSERNFPVHVHLDFLQNPPRRFIQILGSKGSLVFDYYSNILKVNLLGAESEVTSYNKFARNDMFTEEIDDFIQSAKKRLKPPIPLEEAAEVLAICLAAKRSLKTGSVEELI